MFTKFLLESMHINFIDVKKKQKNDVFPLDGKNMFSEGSKNLQTVNTGQLCFYHQRFMMSLVLFIISDKGRGL